MTANRNTPIKTAIENIGKAQYKNEEITKTKIVEELEKFDFGKEGSEEVWESALEVPLRDCKTMIDWLRTPDEMDDFPNNASDEAIINALYTAVGENWENVFVENPKVQWLAGVLGIDVDFLSADPQGGLAKNAEELGREDLLYPPIMPDVKAFMNRLRGCSYKEIKDNKDLSSELQKLITGLGIDTKGISGWGNAPYGPQTTKKVEELQTKLNDLESNPELIVNGQFDEKTFEALEVALSTGEWELGRVTLSSEVESAPDSFGIQEDLDLLKDKTFDQIESNKGSVEALQRILNRFGAKLTVDGQYGTYEIKDAKDKLSNTALAVINLRQKLLMDDQESAKFDETLCERLQTAVTENKLKEENKILTYVGQKEPESVDTDSVKYSESSMLQGFLKNLSYMTDENGEFLMNVPKVMAEAKNKAIEAGGIETKEGAEAAKLYIRGKVKEVIRNRLQRWINAQKEVASRQRLARAQDAMLKDKQIATQEGLLGGNKIESVINKGYGGLFGARGNELIIEDPILAYVFGQMNTKELIDIQNSFSKENHEDKITPTMFDPQVEKLLNEMMEKFDFADLKDKFQVLDVEKNEDHKRIALAKMRKVPEGLKGSALEEEYFDYVKQNGPASADFQEWKGERMKDMNLFEKIGVWFKEFTGGWLGDTPKSEIVDKLKEEVKSPDSQVALEEATAKVSAEKNRNDWDEALGNPTMSETFEDWSTVFDFGAIKSVMHPSQFYARMNDKHFKEIMEWAVETKKEELPDVSKSLLSLEIFNILWADREKFRIKEDKLEFKLENCAVMKDGWEKIILTNEQVLGRLEKLEDRKLLDGKVKAGVMPQEIPNLWKDKERRFLKPGIQSFFTFDASAYGFWNGYELSEDDLKLLAKKVGKGNWNWAHAFDNSKNAFSIYEGAENSSNHNEDYHTLNNGKLEKKRLNHWKPESGEAVFEVGGSAWIDNFRFDSIEAFITWLKG